MRFIVYIGLVLSTLFAYEASLERPKGMDRMVVKFDLGNQNEI